MTFIDDHTRLSSVYLMKEKSDVENFFKKFYTMVQTQFQKNNQILRSDNCQEYFKKILGQFFLEKGIVHQSSSINTPQQNGLTERKNKHLLEITRALLFTNKYQNIFGVVENQRIFLGYSLVYLYPFLYIISFFFIFYLFHFCVFITYINR